MKAIFIADCGAKGGSDILQAHRWSGEGEEVGLTEIYITGVMH